LTLTGYDERQNLAKAMVQTVMRQNPAVSSQLLCRCKLYPVIRSNKICFDASLYK